MEYFIADTHFNDEKIIAYENRPFKDVKEMNETIIKNWNSVVKDNDIVYHLGDVGQGKDLINILSTLRGNKILIVGNHDNKENYNLGFDDIISYPIILNDFWILSHKPMYINRNMPYVNIFGHVHNSSLYKTFSNQHYCVSVERINYTPISFNKIKEKINSFME